ncbi:hypothetical protein X777_02123, partial [Ooceraea biroi]
NIGKSMSRLDLGLQNSSAMAHQTRGLPQLRIKFCATVAAGLQIVLLLTVLPQDRLADEIVKLIYFSQIRIMIKLMHHLDKFAKSVMGIIECCVCIKFYVIMAFNVRYLSFPMISHMLIPTESVSKFSRSSQNPTMASPRGYVAAPIRYELTSRERYIISKVRVNLPAESCDYDPGSKRLVAHENPQNDL